jgi:hypothetical protein
MGLAFPGTRTEDQPLRLRTAGPFWGLELWGEVPGSIWSRANDPSILTSKRIRNLRHARSSGHSVPVFGRRGGFEPTRQDGHLSTIALNAVFQNE